MKRKISHRLLLSLVAGTCMVLAMKVTADYNHSVDFLKYKTYSWLKVEAGNRFGWTAFPMPWIPNSH